MRPRRSHVSGPRIAWELKLPLTASSAVSTGVNAPSGLPEPTSFMLSSEPPVTSAVAVMPGNSLAIMVPIPPPVLGAAAFSDRRIPQDFLPRGDCDGGHSDRSLLLQYSDDGRA
jgi:hypothetical protein